MSDAEQQRQEHERAKTIELTKEMKKARSTQHYRLEERQAWMTQGATGPSAEDYLLGKEVKSTKTAVREEVEKMQQAAGSLLAKTKKTSTVLEAEARLREDPMMAFQRAELAERKKIITNPVKMKKLTDKVTLLKELRKAAKKARKEQKKKHKKKKKGSDSSDSSESEEEVRDRSRSRESGRSRDNGRSSSSGRRDDEGNRGRRDSGAQKPLIPAAMAAKYGLIHPNGARAAASLVRASSPSPDRSKASGGGLVKSEEGGKGGVKRERSPEKPVERVKGRRPSQMSEEEKQRRLLEMQADASVHDKASFERLVAHKTQIKKEDDQFRSGDRTVTNSASFIKDLNKEVFAGKETLEDRLNKHKHYRQKGSTEMHSFL